MRLRCIVHWIIILIPPTFVVCWSISLAANTWWATQTWKQALSPQSPTEIQQSLQRHFLKHQIYVPIEDIVVKQGNGRINNLLEDVCGYADAYIWLPLKIRIPFYDYKVLQWCWKITFKEITTSD